MNTNLFTRARKFVTTEALYLFSLANNDRIVCIHSVEPPIQLVLGVVSMQIYIIAYWTTNHIVVSAADTGMGSAFILPVKQSVTSTMTHIDVTGTVTVTVTASVRVNRS